MGKGMLKKRPKLTRICRGFLALCFFVLCASCVQPTEDDPVYTVTITQPRGGTISAAPESGPAGTVITLTNSPGAGYRFDHYTVDGAAIPGGAFTLNSNVTVSGVFASAGGEPVLYTVTITQPRGGTIGAAPTGGPAGTVITLTNSPGETHTFSHYTVDGAAIPGGAFVLNSDVTVSGVFVSPVDDITNIPNLGAGGPAAVLTIPVAGNDVRLDIGTSAANYADPAAPGAISLGKSLSGKSVTINFDSQGPASVSLAYVHYVREAVKAAGGTVASVNADAAKFTPVFDGREWWNYDPAYSPIKENNLYSSYSTSVDTPLMDGIAVSKDTSSGKYVLKYDRELKVSNLVWQSSKNWGNDGPNAPFYGLG